MHSNRFGMLSGLMILLAALMMMSGCSKHYVDVYINDDCKLTTLDGTDPIKLLLVFPEDLVIFNNLREDSVEVNLPPGMFETEKVVIESKERVILEVVAKGSMDGYLNLECPGGSGNPKVKVGEGP